MLVTPEVHPAATTAADELQPITARKTCSAGRLHNNEGENSLRGLCLGRKNWLFLGSDRGGCAAAVHFSLLASCKRHGHDPWAYYRDILIRLPAMLPTATAEELLALLPHRWKPA
jgi:hypothetical protein